MIEHIEAEIHISHNIQQGATHFKRSGKKKYKKANPSGDVKPKRLATEQYGEIKCAIPPFQDLEAIEYLVKLNLVRIFETNENFKSAQKWL